MTASRGEPAFGNAGFSYSAQALAARGFNPGANVTDGGTTYTWPGAAAGRNDTVVSAPGQTIPMPNAPQGAAHLSFLGSSTNGPSSDTTIITDNDGTTQTATPGFSDWTLNAGSASLSYGNVMVCQMPYHNSTSSISQQVTTDVFTSASISLNTGKRVASITLPGTVTQGHLHIFAWSFS